MTTDELATRKAKDADVCTQGITDGTTFKCVYYYNVFCSEELDCKDCKIRIIKQRNKNVQNGNA